MALSGDARRRDGAHSGRDTTPGPTMHIVQHAHLKAQHHDGERNFAAADRSLGVQSFEVWMRCLDPGARSVEQTHAGELAVLVLSGCGKLLIDGGPQRFVAPCTVLVPPHRRFTSSTTAASRCSWSPSPAPRSSRQVAWSEFRSRAQADWSGG